MADDSSNPLTTLDFNSLASDLSKYVVAPLNAFGLGGFVFDIEGETVTNLSTEITDHYLEDATVVQDNIAVHPTRVTLKNYVGEVVYRRDGSTNTFLQQLTQKLTILNQYVPEAAAGAQQAANIFNQTDPANGVIGSLFSSSNIGLSDVVDLWALTKNLLASSSRQVQAYQYFKSLMTQKILVGIQTPHEFLTNMAIESIAARQPDDTKDMSDFTITLKQIRIAKTAFVPFNASDYQGAAAAQAAPTVNSTNVQGADESLLYQVQQAGATPLTTAVNKLFPTAAQ
jgi:hypothetical protein